MPKLYRHKHGKGFTYRWLDGTTLKDKAKRKFIEELMIPPAWRDVEIQSDTNAKVYATGRDAAGRKQYIYNPAYTKVREKKKFARIVRFGRQLETMRRTTGQHMREMAMTKQKVLACMVRLIDSAYFRPGNDQYSQENETYGLTTMRTKHLQIDDDKLVFEYVGKSSKDQKRIVEDERLAKIVSELDDMPGYEIFQYYEDGEKNSISSRDLNAYIKEIMGEDFSAKDFRTWAGTVVAAVALDELGLTEDEKQAKGNIVQAVRKVANILGNTESVARANYIDPKILETYTEGRTISYFKNQIQFLDEEALSSVEERAVLKLLDYATDA